MTTATPKWPIWLSVAELYLCRFTIRGIKSTDIVASTVILRSVAAAGTSAQDVFNRHFARLLLNTTAVALGEKH